MKAQAMYRQAASSLSTTIIDQAPIGILLASSESVFFANACAYTLFGYPADKRVSERPLEILLTAKARHRFRSAIDGVLIGGYARQQTELTAVRADGGLIELEAQLSAIEHEGTRVALVLLSDTVRRDLTQQSLRMLAFNDSLTGLPNRALFLDRLNQALRQCKRTNTRFALMLVDIDDFKLINDTHGHDVGDLVLRELSDILLHAVRLNDTVARLGGDEFTVILQGTDSASSAMRVAEQIQYALARRMQLGDVEVQVRASVGIANCPEHAADMHGLIVAADAAMYESKHAGGAAARYASAHRSAKLGISPLAIHWSTTLEYGVDWLDAEHRGLVDAINSLVTAFSCAEEMLVVQALMDQLIETAARHFASEESHMHVLDAEEQRCHRQEHQRALSELSGLGSALDTTGLSQTIQLMRDWLFSHIRHADRHLCEMLGAAAGGSANAVCG